MTGNEAIQDAPTDTEFLLALVCRRPILSFGLVRDVFLMNNLISELIWMVFIFSSFSCEQLYS